MLEILRRDRETESRKNGSLKSPLPEEDGERKLPSEHPLWERAGSVILAGHKVVDREVKLVRPGWWQVRTGIGESFAVRAKNQQQARELVPREAGAVRGTAELYPDHYKLGDREVNPHELLDETYGFGGEKQLDTAAVRVVPFSFRAVDESIQPPAS